MFKFLKKKSLEENSPNNFLEGVGVPVVKSKKIDVQSKAFRIRLIATLCLAIVGLGAMFLLGDRQPDEKLVQKISKMIVLPDEEPVIATITNYELVKSNPFYQDAKQNDVVLLFKKMGKVILYSRDSNKVLNVGSMQEAGITAQ